ncbi:MAG: hypothetical protein ABW184_00880 [Sphingobium sp.]
MRSPVMAGKRALKVYRTSIGFQDAYVAAPSQKAALAAWGTEKNLFARGAAEIVTDARLTKAALAQPGVVVRQARGTTAEHLAATREPKRNIAAPVAEADPPPPKKRAPRPSRDRLARAEAALEKSRRSYEDGLAKLDAQIERLRSERADLRAERDAEIGRLEERRDSEDDRYRRALDDWEG